MRELVIDWIRSFYEHKKGNSIYFNEDSFLGDLPFWTVGLLVMLVVASVIIWFVARQILLEILHKIAVRSKATWDDHFMKNKVFKGLALLVPLFFMEYFLSIVFFGYPSFKIFGDKIVSVLILVAVMVVVNRALNAIHDIIFAIEVYRDKPIRSYIQVIKIVFFGILTIALLSVLTDRSPLFFLTSLGAISAILILVFKDTILGFVSSIQLASNDMIRIGDWITMDKFGADGDVEEINLTTVKIRNFDRTITTIPTYSFISDSFKNWRGMHESEGRRIKRSLNVSVDTVKFASPELIEKLSKVGILHDFIVKRQSEIDAYNRLHGLEDDAMINKRRQTNVGLFRRYVEYYLRNNTQINSRMPLLVRQLPATETGVPIEVYCFTHTKEWESFEVIISDLFDHLFAIIREFELDLFESPSGKDWRTLKF